LRTNEQPPPDDSETSTEDLFETPAYTVDTLLDEVFEFDAELNQLAVDEKKRAKEKEKQP
jgi:hypothetical protein